MKNAMGMVEVRSLVGAIEAADTMVKSADVRIVEVEYVGSGIVSVLVEGEVAAVKSAVDNGRKSAEKISEVISSNVIPRPHKEVEKILG